MRPAGVAGAWYPADAKELKQLLDGFLEKPGTPKVDGKLVGLVVPHAGYTYSGQTAAYAYALLRGKSFDRVIVLGPSHYTDFRGFAIPDASAWDTPLGAVKIPASAAATLRKDPLSADPKSIGAHEHSLEAQLPFIKRMLPEAEVLPILIGPRDGPEELDRIAEILRPLLSDRTLLVASSDFTHYGQRFDYVPFSDRLPERLRQLDMGGIERILALDARGFGLHIDVTGDTVCGRQPIAILLRALPGSARGTLLHYDTSGAETGDWSNSVSYAAIAITTKPGATTEAPQKEAPPSRGALGTREKAALIDLARATLRSTLVADESLARAASTLDTGGILSEPLGVFVTIERKDPAEIETLGKLRGCIGDIFGSEPLYLGVIHNAINASTRDPRFPSMDAAELDKVEIEISVLDRPRPIASFAEIVPGKHGVLISKSGHRGVFLPQVATEQGWGRDELLDNLCRKAGLEPGCWREGAELQIFTAQVFGEHERLAMHTDKP